MGGRGRVAPYGPEGPRGLLRQCLHQREPGTQLRAARPRGRGRAGAHLAAVRPRALHDRGRGAARRGEDREARKRAAGPQPAVGNDAGGDRPQERAVVAALDRSPEWSRPGGAAGRAGGRTSRSLLLLRWVASTAHTIFYHM